MAALRRGPSPASLALAARCSGPRTRAAAAPPWRGAAAVREPLGSTRRRELILGDAGPGGERGRRRPLARVPGALEPSAPRPAPHPPRRPSARAASGRGPPSSATTALALSRGRARRGRRSLAARSRLAVAAAARGGRATARAWLLVREFRTATRFTRPGADGDAGARRGSRAGGCDRRGGGGGRAKDLLDAYQARLRELPRPRRAAGRRRGLRVAPRRGGRAAPRLLDDPRRRATRRPRRGAAEAPRAAFARRARAAARGARRAAVTAARAAVAAALDGFTAAPLTGRGGRAPRAAAAALPRARAGRVRARRQRRAGDARLRDPGGDRVPRRRRRPPSPTCESVLAKRDPARDAAAGAELAVARGATWPTRRAAARWPTPSERRSAQAERDRSISPTRCSRHEWKKADRRVRLRPDRDHARPHGGRASAPASTTQAEQARLEAYAFFEFGPERRLRALDPGLAVDVEGLIWYGAGDQPGLATLIAERAAAARDPRDAPGARRAARRRRGRRSATAPARPTVVTNSAIIVFREGLEAVLILAAITASFVGAQRAPAPAGAGRRGRSACSSRSSPGCSRRRCSPRSQRYGEKLEAVVGAGRDRRAAAGPELVLPPRLLDRVDRALPPQRRGCAMTRGGGFVSAQVLGLGAARLDERLPRGLRDRALPAGARAEADTGTVLLGRAGRPRADGAVGVAVFVLQRKLPYKRMLIVTGVLIASCSSSWSARPSADAGRRLAADHADPWAPAALLARASGSASTRRGRRIGAQVAAAVFVIGSYFAAEGLRKRRRRAITVAAIET